MKIGQVLKKNEIDMVNTKKALTIFFDLNKEHSK